MVLVKFYSNYADEFDCEGFCLYDNMEEFKRILLITWLIHHGDEWDSRKFKKFSIEELENMVAPTSKQNMEMSFGTNEEFIFEDFEDFEDSFRCQEITKIEAEIIKKYFGSKYGFYPRLED